MRGQDGKQKGIYKGKKYPELGGGGEFIKRREEKGPKKKRETRKTL